MKNLLKSKKGGIPAVNEIVMSFLNITPKPILILIFILLLTTISAFIIPTFLNLFGYECIGRNDEFILYQVPMSKMATKSIQDVREGLRGIVGFEDYKLPDNPFPNGDKTRLRIPPDCFVDATVNGTTTIGYSSACVDCTKSGLFRYWGSVCLDDGYYDSTFVTTSWIGTANYCYRCSPPDPYFYNHSLCTNSDDCYFQITDPSLVSQITDDYSDHYTITNLLNLGAVERTQDSSEFINVQCIDNDKPQLYFFNIELFNKQMWILLVVGWALTSFAYMYYSVVL